MPGPGEKARPTIALAVEPRMLRESLARVLDDHARVTQLAQEDNGDVEPDRRFDIILTSAEPTLGEPEADVVLCLSDDRSERPPSGRDARGTDVRVVEDILAAIDRWKGGGTGSDRTG